MLIITDGSVKNRDGRRDFMSHVQQVQIWLICTGHEQAIIFVSMEDSYGTL